jgi:hypothetical protein
MQGDNKGIAEVDSKKADFRKSVYYYVAFNLLMWAVWWFTTGKITGFTGYPWPIWLMIGWGAAMVKQFIQAYFRK